MGTTNAQSNSGSASDEVHVSRPYSIDAFFAEKVILLTGATGFLGKVLLEKLLRSCPHVDTIFVLIRSKRNQSLEERFQKLLENPVRRRLCLLPPCASCRACRRDPRRFATSSTSFLFSCREKSCRSIRVRSTSVLT